MKEKNYELHHHGNGMEGGRMKVYITLLKARGDIKSITGVYKTKKEAQKAIKMPAGYVASGICHEVVEEYKVTERGIEHDQV